MGITERREKEKHEMRQSILDAAMNLFIEEGYESVSIRKIAEKIEYSPSTIYLYFEDKDAIFFELHNIGFNKLHNLQNDVQTISDPKQRLIAHGRAYLKFAVENPEYYDIMFLVRNPVKIIHQYNNWECGERAYNLLIKNVKECINEGYFRDQAPEAVAFLLWSSVHGMASLMIRKRLVLQILNVTDSYEIFDEAMKVLDSFIK